MDARLFGRRRIGVVSSAVGIALGLAVLIGWAIAQGASVEQPHSTARHAPIAADGDRGNSRSSLPRQAAIHLDVVPEEHAAHVPGPTVIELEPILIEASAPHASTGTP